MRVVLDTNVLVSSLLFGGQLSFIVELLKHGEITPCFSFDTWNELERILRYPKLATPLNIINATPEDILNRLQLDAVFVINTKSPLRLPDDPADEALIACALTSGAKVLVTGDQYLLSFKNKAPVGIMTPKEFQLQW